MYVLGYRSFVLSSLLVVTVGRSVWLKNGQMCLVVKEMIDGIVRFL